MYYKVMVNTAVNLRTAAVFWKLNYIEIAIYTVQGPMDPAIRVQISVGPDYMRCFYSFRFF